MSSGVVTFSRSDPAFQELAAIVSERSRPIVFWTGAGLSVAAGLPTWPALKKALADDGRARAASLKDEDIAPALGRIDRAESEPNYWVAFQLLRDALGAATFASSVRRELGGATSCDIPSAYELIWKLPIRGIITLNIDRLAVRAFSRVASGRAVNEFNGRDMARLAQTLFSPTSFVANAHGHFEDERSWCFTQSDLSHLLRDENYLAFLRTVLSTCVNVFVGMSVDDVAVGGHLDRLMRLDVQSSPRFWFSDRSDVKIDDWAQQRGTQIIRYRPEPTHEAAVLEFLEALRGAGPSVDAEPLPIVPAGNFEEAVTWNRGDLNGLSLDEARAKLNQVASTILARAGTSASNEYDEFCAEFAQEIHNAWFVTTSPPENLLLGHRIIERAARGAFGTVYRAEDPAGNPVAVKLLQQEVHEDRDLLRAFRQGVSSMRILEKYNLPNMVTYKQAYELPAFVVMDWVEGLNLVEFRDAGQLGDWTTLLELARQLAGVIRKAHSLPERVLHRDIRPANIMLRDYWGSGGELDVVVLDFDLSWHHGSENKSVYFTTAIGYLAPEQIDERTASTRNALVDSFGISMTLYYLVTGRDPLPEQHRHVDFAAEVESASRFFEVEPSWRSLPRRFARLVVSGCSDDQENRPDVSRIESEVSHLKNCALGETSQLPLSHLAEELAARTESLSNYVWVSEEILERTLPSGVAFVLVADESKGVVRLEVAWTRTGVEQRAGLAKYVEQGAQTARQRLESAGWETKSHEVGGQSMRSVYSISKQLLIQNLDTLGQRTSDALDSLQFGPAG